MCAGNCTEKAHRNSIKTTVDFVVDLRRFELPTPTMRMWCAPSCATSPFHLLGYYSAAGGQCQEKTASISVNQHSSCISAVILITSCQGNSKEGSIHFQRLFLLKTFLSVWGLTKTVNADIICGEILTEYWGLRHCRSSPFPIFSRSGITEQDN